MNLVVDTSVIIAVLTSEPERARLVELTSGVNLITPASVHWEVGNALAAMFKRGRIDGKQVKQVLRAYERIPIQYLDVALGDALELALEHGLYAYDAYVLACAMSHRCRLISLDKGLVRAAGAAGIGVLEVGE
ncbi:MAG: type II toxin-antitoxin system VapC family toxin [bacterium]